MQNLKEYLRPGSATEAVRMKQQYGRRAVYLAGGSDLLVHRPPHVEVAVDILHADLGYVLDGGDDLVIGGAALLRDAEIAVAGLTGNMLALAFRDTAPWLIRNSATVAGNIANASPAADSVPALLAVDAELLVLGDREERVMLSDVLVGPHQTTLGDRLIREIRIPQSVIRRRGIFKKLARSHSDIAQVNMAVSYIDDGDLVKDVRIAVGAVAPTAVRATGAEALVEGHAPADVDLDRVEKAVRDGIAPISDWRASAEYRSRMAGVLVRQALQSLFAGLETGVAG